MKKPLTLSMKFSPLAPIPVDEAERRHEEDEAKRKKEDPFNLKNVPIAQRDASGKLPVQLRREDFLNKEFILPNPVEAKGKVIDATTLTTVPVQTMKADYLNKIKEDKVITQMDQPVTGLLATFMGHTSAVTCCTVAVIEDEEFVFTGSMDCTIRVFSVVTGNCVSSFEGHTDTVTSVHISEVTGTERHNIMSRIIKNTLNPRWGNLETDLFEFQLKNFEKIITCRVYDWDMVGEHDLIGTVEIDLEMDVLQGNHQDDPATSEWYAIQLDGKGDRGQLHIEFQWKNRTKTLGILLLQATKLPAMDGLLGKADPYVAFSIQDKPSQRLFTSSADGNAICWDIYARRSLQKFVGHRRAVTKVQTAWAFAKHSLFTSSLDRTVRMWDLETGACTKVITHDVGVCTFELKSISFGQSRQVTEDMIKVPADIRVKVKYDVNPMTKAELLTVTILEARNLPAMDGALGTSDPYCVVRIGDVKHQTKVKKKTLDPAWNEQFEFTDFRLEDELVVEIYDWDAVNAVMGSGDYIGNISFLLDEMVSIRVVMEWFPVDHEPYSQTHLYTGCADGSIRMFNLRLGTELREFISHEGNITDIKLIEFKGKKQLFSSSLDGSIKMWETKKSSRTVTKAIRSWTHPSSVNSICSLKILKTARIFGACNDGIVYMNSLPTEAVQEEKTWRSKVQEFVGSIQVSVLVLICCLVDAVTALVFEFGIPADQIDCFSRDSLVSTVIVFTVLSVFTIELLANIAASGKSFFVPVKGWNYMDLIVVTISLGVAFYKVYYDASVEVKDKDGKWLPPIVSTKSHPELCAQVSGTATSAQASATQKSLTTIRIARMIARITLGVRVLRALVKAAKIAARLGDLQKGKEFRGHKSWLSTVVPIAPTTEKTSALRLVIKKVLKRMMNADEKYRMSLEDYRLDLRSRYRFLSGCADGTVYMWDATTDQENYRRDRPRFDHHEIMGSGFNLTMQKKKALKKVKNIRKNTVAEREEEKLNRRKTEAHSDDEFGVEIIRIAV